MESRKVGKTTVSYEGIIEAPHFLKKLRECLRIGLDPNMLEIRVTIETVVEGPGITFELVAKDISRSPTEVILRYRAGTEIVVVFNERRRLQITDILERFHYEDAYGTPEEVEFKIALVHI